MNSELEFKLQDNFPFMQRKLKMAEGTLYCRWGCECGNGWYKLIYDLCKEIAKAFEREGKPVNIIVKRVKEKFGKLCFYYTFGDELLLSNDESDIVLRSEVKKIVKTFEERSIHTCEICGNEGCLHKDTIIRILCNNCYMQLLSKKNKTKVSIK